MNIGLRAKAPSHVQLKKGLQDPSPSSLQYSHRGRNLRKLNNSNTEDHVLEQVSQAVRNVDEAVEEVSQSPKHLVKKHMSRNYKPKIKNHSTIDVTNAVRVALNCKQTRETSLDDRI